MPYKSRTTYLLVKHVRVWWRKNTFLCGLSAGKPLSLTRIVTKHMSLISKLHGFKIFSLGFLENARSLKI